jgi:hypothetical protein
MDAEAPAVTSGGLSDAALRLFALNVVVATVVGRALEPALPGSSAGIARWILTVDRASAFLTQAACVFGALLTIYLLQLLRRGNVLGGTYWLIAVPAGLCVSLVVAAMQSTLAPHMSLGLGVMSALVALCAAPRSLASAGSRAVGLVLGLSGLSALVHLGSRMLAIIASERALRPLFDLSRNLATLGLVLDAVGLLLAVVWACSRRWVLFVVLSLVVTGIAVALSVLGQRGVRYDATLGEVLLARSLGELVRHPAPFLTLWMRQAFEVAIFAWSICFLLLRRHAASLEVALALAILARAGTDVPAFGLFLVVAALLAALGSVDERRLRRAVGS